MKFLHLSDLHIGKRVNGFSMLEDQEYILEKILEIVSSEKPNGVLIAGDIYDKTVPPAAAVSVFDEFLVKLSKLNCEVFIISGNHDSPERLAFANRLMEGAGVHISSVYNGEVLPYVLEADGLKVNIYSMPFVKPANVKAHFPDIEINNYTDALRTAIEHMQINENEINICIAHQFVTGATRCDSEENVGGLDNVDASVFSVFDYTALGHIHGAQNLGDSKIRYCGSPLKYSFSEKNHRKAVTVIEISDKDNINVRTVDLIPKTDMMQIKGTYDEITRRDYYENKDFKNAYLHIVLTDENDIINVSSLLRIIYKNMMSIEYDNSRTRNYQAINLVGKVENKTPKQLFGELFELRNNKEMTDEQKEYLQKVIEEVWGDI